VKTKLGDLAQRCEVASGPDRRLDAEIALALGWRQMRVGRLGISGRSAGSLYWFAPGASMIPGTPSAGGSRNPPRFTGPRKRTDTIAALKNAAAHE